MSAKELSVEYIGDLVGERVIVVPSSPPIIYGTSGKMSTTTDGYFKVATPAAFVNRATILFRQPNVERIDLRDDKPPIIYLGRDVEVERYDDLFSQIEMAKVAVSNANDSLNILMRQCHDSGHSIKRTEWGSARCRICGKRIGWWCPDSPSHVCSYSSGNRVECTYCGEPKERK